MRILRYIPLTRSYSTFTAHSLYKQQTTPPTELISIKGWIKSIRLLKKIAFIDLQDGSTTHTLRVIVPIQCTTKDTPYLKTLKTGQSISISDAIWQHTPNTSQPFELKITNPEKSIKILGDVSSNYPLQKKNHSFSYLRSLPTLKHRTSYLSSLLRFRSHVEFAFMKFFETDNFTKVAPPILTSNDCEGAGELFKVTGSSKEGSDSAIFKNNDDSSLYFGKPTYLTVSTQLHLEILAMALSKCWTLTPCFRAERSATPRHLYEFWMLETEICFIDRIDELLNYVERPLRYVIQSCIDHQDELLSSPFFVPQEMATIVDLKEKKQSHNMNCIKSEREKILERWKSLVDNPWPRITYTKAIEILQQQQKTNPFPKYEPKWGQPLQTEHEKWISGEYFKGPVFVTDYPRSCKPFYMKVNRLLNDTERKGPASTSTVSNDTVACFDLLVPEMGEIVGGSLREDNYEILLEQMKSQNMNKKGELDWYANLRKEGSVPHGGYGLGFERVVSYLFGNHNIRDAIPFQRSASSVIEL